MSTSVWKNAPASPGGVGRGRDEVGLVQGLSESHGHILHGGVRPGGVGRHQADREDAGAGVGVARVLLGAGRAVAEVPCPAGGRAGRGVRELDGRASGRVCGGECKGGHRQFRGGSGFHRQDVRVVAVYRVFIRRLVQPCCAVEVGEIILLTVSHPHGGARNDRVQNRRAGVDRDLNDRDRGQSREIDSRPC